MRNKKQKGFTLIELLVVIAIIGLLASVVLLALNSARAKSRDAKRLADLRQVASAMELFFNDNNSYPTNTAALNTYNALNATNTSGNNTGKALAPGYIGLIPTAPAPADGTCLAGSGAPTAVGLNDYQIMGVNSVLSTTSYTITFCLGAITGGYGAGPHTLTPSGIQ